MTSSRQLPYSMVLYDTAPSLAAVHIAEDEWLQQAIGVGAPDAPVSFSRIFGAQPIEARIDAVCKLRNPVGADAFAGLLLDGITVDAAISSGNDKGVFKCLLQLFLDAKTGEDEPYEVVATAAASFETTAGNIGIKVSWGSPFLQWEAGRTAFTSFRLRLGMEVYLFGVGGGISAGSRAEASVDSAGIYGMVIPRSVISRR